MYCGKNKTAIASQLQITNAMDRLLEKASFCDISISALCKEADVSRQTFYSLFDSKEDVVVNSLQQLYCNTEELKKEGPMTFREFCCGFSHFIINNSAYFNTLFQNHILYLLYESIYDTFIHCCHHSSLYEDNVLAGGLTGIVRSFCEEGCKASQKELENYMTTLLVPLECQC